MGCSGSSRVFVVNANKPGHSAQNLADLQKLGLTKNEIDNLYSVFCKLDSIGDGDIELDELIHQYKLVKSTFTKEVFTVLNRADRGSLNFHEVYALLLLLFYLSSHFYFFTLVCP